MNMKQKYEIYHSPLLNSNELGDCYTRKHRPGAAAYLLLVISYETPTKHLTTEPILSIFILTTFIK